MINVQLQFMNRACESNDERWTKVYRALSLTTIIIDFHVFATLQLFTARKCML